MAGLDSNPFTREHPNTCLSCGFLSIRSDHRTQPNDLEANARLRGEVPEPKILWCAARAGHLELDIDVARAKHEESGTIPPLFEGEGDWRFALVREVVKQDRWACVKKDAWYEWVENESPQWHILDQRQMRLEEMRQQQTAMMMKVMEDHKKITGTLAEVSESQVKLQEADSTTNKRFNRFFGVLAGLTFFLALSALVYPDGFEWGIDHAPGAVDPRVQQPVVLVLTTPSDAADTTLTPTPTPESVPGTASPQPQSTP